MTWTVAVKTKGKGRGYHWYYGHSQGYHSIAAAGTEAQRIVSSVQSMGETVLSIVINVKEDK